MNMKKLLDNAWQPVLAYTGAGVLAFGLLFFRLSHLLPGMSPNEITQSTFASDFHHIIDNPLYLPHSILQLGLHKLNIVHPLTLRAVSALFGFAILIFFYLLLRYWFNLRVAVAGTALFGTSSWFLHTARLSLPTILLMSLVIVVVAALKLKQASHQSWALAVLAVSGAALLYVPGMIWFVAAGVIWQGRSLGRALKSMPILMSFAAILSTLVLLVPLGWGLFHHPNLLNNWIGLPTHVPSFGQMFKNFLLIPWQLIFKGPNSPELWLGRVPILDVFTVVMIILGIYAYARQLRLDQARLVSGILFLGTILVATGGPVTISVLIPWLYLVAVMGLAYFWQLWLEVFPRNPVARGVGNGLVILALLVVCGFYLLSYFVAWPRSPATKQTFTQHVTG